jgi:hypothetical protein
LSTRMQRRASRVLCLFAAIANSSAQGLYPTCSEGYTISIDSSGGCGLYKCASAADTAGYCPCPFLYKDDSTDKKGSVCSCILGPLCGSRLVALLQLLATINDRQIAIQQTARLVFRAKCPLAAMHCTRFNSCPRGYASSNGACALSAAATGAFSITLMDMGSSPPEYAAVFQQAAARWESIIVADLTDFSAEDAPSDGLGWYAAPLFLCTAKAFTPQQYAHSTG